jgi:exopolysaccharide biosynthesis polyprenyl glycosylphosphotransferase
MNQIVLTLATILAIYTGDRLTATIDWLNDILRSKPAAYAAGDYAPMSSSTPSSLSPLNPASLESATIAENEVNLHSLPLRTEDWISAEGLRFFVKRSVDLVGAALGLLFLAPVMLFIALRIRFDSPGPVLFRQSRRGYRGRMFEVLKFRTMTVDAEQQLTALETSNESAGGVLFKLRNDPRVTRVGSFLRRYSLDELPQLINVLRGEMSLVGPRPLQLRDSNLLLNLNPEAYSRRLQVIPGLSGPWQISGRSELSYQDMIALDLHYVENWSLAWDIRIICKTFLVVLLRRGAY